MSNCIIRENVNSTHWWSFISRCASCPWFSFLTLEHKEFMFHSSDMVAWQKIQSKNIAWNNSIYQIKQSKQTNKPNNVSNIYVLTWSPLDPFSPGCPFGPGCPWNDHYCLIWIILIFVWTIWLCVYTDELQILKMKILTGSPVAPASPLLPSTPTWPWKMPFSALQCVHEHYSNQTGTMWLIRKSNNMSFFFFNFTYNVSKVTRLSSISSVSRRTLDSDGNKYIKQTIQANTNKQHRKNQ